MFETVVERAVARIARRCAAIDDGARTARAARRAGFDAKSFVDACRPAGRLSHARRGGEILYVGKARNLKSRVGSYFQPSNVQPKVQALVRQDREHGSHHHQFGYRSVAARIQPHQEASAALQRGVARRQELSLPAPGDASRFSAAEFLSGLAQGGRTVLRTLSFGGAVRETLQQLQKLFRLRNCDDLYFSNRSRRACISDRALHRACVGLSAKRTTRATSGRRSRCSRAAAMRSSVELARRMERRPSSSLRGSRAGARSVQALR